ncbi:integral membrane protein [Seminavis robusta]|uniref:Integral membrane protein n=1 Tax=Seminavis robusta TaxID=568900 RepID=A0A9N8E9P3_9STRA|nr:integral membrane protein [Seminavis robusta]|eukprot:Sro781_g201630.1 integral membrane protein (262) ;mRNA; r:34402-35187
MHNANNANLDGAIILPNHKLDLKTALKKGFRGLNMDVGTCFDKVTLLHASCLLKTKIPIKIVMKEILSFLDDNPNEVIILPTEIPEDSFLLGPPPTLAQVDEVFQSVDGWKEKMYDHPGPGNAWPTLQELIDTDKRIIYFFYRGERCTKGVDCPVGFHPWFDYAAETQFSFPFIWSFDDKAYACEITRGGSGTRDFFGVNVFTTPARFFSPILRVHKADFLRTHLQACKDLNGGLQPNVVLVDFWKVGDVMKVVDELNAAL